MKRCIPLVLALAAAPAFAQTDSMADSDLESRIGPAFYSDDTWSTLRSSEELNTAWTGLDTADQTELRTRCEAIGVNFQTDMTDSSGASGSGVEPTDGAGAGAPAAEPQEAMTESSGASGSGVEATEGAGEGAPAAEPQEPMTESSGTAGSGVEPSPGAGLMADETRLRALCDAVAGM